MKAMILCGGKGTRTQEKYPGIPKALIPYKGKPMLEHHLEKLKTNLRRCFFLLNFDEILFCKQKIK